MRDMVSRLGLIVSGVFRSVMPDPFVIAIGLAFVTALCALLFGDFPPEARSRAAFLLDAWRDDNTGFWRFLLFGMQMCLVLVTGHALAATRPVGAAIDRIAAIPRRTSTAAFLVSFASCVVGLINWGLGLIVGALLAREVGTAMAKRGIRVHYPLLAAAGYTTMMIWHGGLSGSAPLSMTTVRAARAVLDESLIASLGGFAGAAPEQAPLVTLDQTLFSPMNLVITGGLLLLVPALLMLLAPPDHAAQGIEEFRPAGAGTPDPGQAEPQDLSLPERLNQSRVVAGVLGVSLAAGVVRAIAETGPMAIGLNQINMAMLALGLLLHGSPKAYMEAASDAARGCGGIIVQFPIYGGIMGMLASTGLVARLAGLSVEYGSQTTLPLLSFIAACIINLFVPSGGGQWAIQGPIALASGMQAGVEPGTMVLSVAYGDQITNMLQPFWALPLLAITGVKARDIIGYTTLAMIAGFLWTAVVLLVA